MQWTDNCKYQCSRLRSVVSRGVAVFLLTGYESVLKYYHVRCYHQLLYVQRVAIATALRCFLVCLCVCELVMASICALSDINGRVFRDSKQGLMLLQDFTSTSFGGICHNLCVLLCGLHDRDFS